MRASRYPVRVAREYRADGDVHKYFSPYCSPYDVYINFMNTLGNVRTRIAGLTSAAAGQAARA